ncbi:MULTISPECIES: sensor histidine kinase [Streptacidiphilus]|uniref:histidine kinase n=1 Tax=Streptacidiphilus cavernicola TaxID=3342716 RepID=A0ABV6UVW5_9ACTN|nr:histidine kinase [Streptacidiphilus jeojiense]
MDQASMRFVLSERLMWLTGKGVVFCAFITYAFLLFWSAPVAQSRTYQGPFRFPTLTAPQMTAMALALALPVLLVQHRPVAGLGALLAETVLAAEVGARSWAIFAAAAVTVCYLAVVRPVKVCGVAAAALVAVWFLENVLIEPRSVDGDLWSTSAQMALYATCAFLVGYAIRKRRQYALSLREQSAARAVMAERLRIARELHDMVAHSIGIIAVLAGAAGRVIETQPVEAREALGSIETTSRETLTGLQRMLGALRHAEPGTDVEAAPLVPAQCLDDVDQLAARAADAGVSVEVAWRGERRQLPPEIDLSAFRIIQEAVTNVVRHSGTHACRVEVGFAADELSIEIVDNGHGLALARPGGGGFGLLGMRERVALLSGQFSAGPRPEGGFRVAARLPV